MGSGNCGKIEETRQISQKVIQANRNKEIYYKKLSIIVEYYNYTLFNILILLMHSYVALTFDMHSSIRGLG